MRSDFVPVNEPLLDGNESKYLIECIESGWISSEGPFVAEFEHKLARRVERNFGIAVCNGTAAIDIAVAALGIGPGDEVILPTFTIISCINQIVRAGAVPVVVDSDPLTWNMDVNQLEERINERTKAIMIVHIYGLPTNVDPVLELARKYELRIIEDASQMLGQTYKERPCGSFGDISTFSFYPNKHVTTGEGGMVVTNDESLAERCREFRNLCFQPARRFVHDELGWNYRMTNLQAAIGLAQLERLDEFIARKREIGHQYNEIFKEISDLQLPVLRTDYADNIYWVYGVLIHDTCPITADQAIDSLLGLGVGARPFFYPMHRQPVLRRMGFFHNEDHEVSNRLYNKGFYLPSGLGLTELQMKVVGDAIHKVFQ